VHDRHFHFTFTSAFLWIITTFGYKQKFIKKQEKEKKKTLQPLTSVTGVTHRSLAFFCNGRNFAKKERKRSKMKWLLQRVLIAKNKEKVF
jgi:hypothetical protein